MIPVRQRWKLPEVDFNGEERLSSVIEHLQQLGFTRYEAAAYVTLLQRNPLNGYELAKLSGIPRPNVYPLLQKLEERGAVVRLDTPDGIRYAPVASGELIQRLQSHFQDNLDNARCALEGIKSQPEQEFIWNARGYPALLDHAQSLVDMAERELLVAIWPQEAQSLADNLERASARGVDLTTLCLAGCKQECGHCQGHVFREHLQTDQDTRWLLLIPDDVEVLAGEIGSGDEALAVRTRQRLLVSLIGDYIRQSISLSRLLLALGDRFDELVGPDSRPIEVAGLRLSGARRLSQLHQFLDREGRGFNHQS
jgi:DNA-binding MarR family transcriptional regulator